MLFYFASLIIILYLEGYWKFEFFVKYLDNIWRMRRIINGVSDVAFPTHFLNSRVILFNYFMQIPDTLVHKVFLSLGSINYASIP